MRDNASYTEYVRQPNCHGRLDHISANLPSSMSCRLCTTGWRWCVASATHQDSDSRCVITAFICYWRLCSHSTARKVPPTLDSKVRHLGPAGRLLLCFALCPVWIRVKLRKFWYDQSSSNDWFRIVHIGQQSLPFRLGVTELYRQTDGQTQLFYMYPNSGFYCTCNLLLLRCVLAKLQCSVL